MFPESGQTKLDLVRYYEAVGVPLMRAMGGRPVLMQRFPNGAGGSSFFQKRVPDNAPDWLETTIVSTPNGTTSRALVAADVAHIAWAVNLGCLGFHVWPNRADDPEHADELRIDLDPQPGVGFAEIREAARGARAARRAGNRGLAEDDRQSRHPRVPQARAPMGSDRGARRVRSRARELARRRPDLITDAWWKEERGERVFVDFNQNAPHKTVFGAWSVRARPGAPGVDAVRLGRARRHRGRRAHDGFGAARVAKQGDPWEHIDARPQSLQPLLDMSERDLASGLQDAPWPPVYPKMPGEPPRVAPSRAKKNPSS